MNTSSQSKIDDLIRDGYHVDIGKYISIAWENFKQAPLMYIGYLLLFGIISWALDKFPLGIGHLLLPLFSIGFVLFANKIQQNEEARFEHFFDGFKTNPVHLILVGVASSLIMLALTLPMITHIGLKNTIEFIMNPYNSGFIFSTLDFATIGIWGALAAIPAIYLSVGWMWAYFFVAFKGLDFWSAMETSRKVITKQWFQFLGLSIALVGLIIVGVLCLGVGLLIAIPVATIVPFIAFEQIIGVDNDYDYDVDTIGDF